MSISLSRQSSVGEHNCDCKFRAEFSICFQWLSLDVLQPKCSKKSNGFWMWSLRAKHKSKMVLLLISPFSLFDLPFISHMLFVISTIERFVISTNSHFRYETWAQLVGIFHCAWKTGQKLLFYWFVCTSWNFVDFKPHSDRLLFNFIEKLELNWNWNAITSTCILVWLVVE